MVAEIKDFSMLDEQVRRGRIEQGAARETEAARDEETARWREADREREAEDFRAVAPPVMSFASGRRR